MAEFMVTFGQKYRRETHPTFGEAHPDGWLTIEADTYEQARAIVEGWLGLQWSGLYEACDFDGSYYPRGELHRIAAGVDAALAQVGDHSMLLAEHTARALQRVEDES